MNKFFKSVWNESVGAWVATSEKSPARGKRSGRAAKAVLASAFMFTTLSAVASGLDGGSLQNNGSGMNNGEAVGTSAVANADFGSAFGPGATAAGVGDVGIGADAKVDSGAQTGDGGVRGSVGIGSNAKATGASATAIGGLANAGSQATAIGSNANASSSGSLALGYNATAGASSAISIGTSSKATFANSVAIGSNSSTDRMNSVSIGNSGFQRTLTAVARGTQQYDATNVAQLSDVTALFGGGAAVNADGTIAPPSYTANGSTVANVADAVAALDSGLNDRVKYDTTAHDKVTLGTAATAVTLTNVKDGALTSTSLDAVNGSQLYATNQKVDALSANLNDGVNYDTTSHDQVTLGAAGTPVKVTNVAPGALGATSVDAVNGSQLFSTNQDVSKLNTKVADAVLYDTTAHDKVTLGNAGTPVAVTNVAPGALGATSVDAVNGSQLFATNQDVSKLKATTADAVLYDTTSHNQVTLGAAGTPVKVTNVAPGAIGASSVDAVNGSQLFGLSSSAASALGGGAAVNSDGTLKKPAYSLDNGTFTADNVGSALGNLDGRVTKNTNDINTWTTNITTGQVGIVQQNLETRVITVGAATNGGEVSVAGTTGSRVVSGVANGDISATSNQAVNGSQLYGASASIASALGGGSVVNKDGSVSAPVYNVGGTQVTGVGAAIDNLDGRVSKNTSDIAGIKGDVANVSNVAANAVAYDSSSHDKVTLGGQTPADGSAPDAVQLTNVKDGELSTTSTDAVNGKQLNDTNSRLDAYAGAINNIENTGVGFLAVNSSTATAALPVASGTDAVAIGANSKATGNNSVALGAGSVADQDNTVSVGAAGSERRVTNVAAGQSGTDATNMNQLNAVRNELGSNIASVQRGAYSGVAAAMAMPNLTPSGPGKTVVAAGVGNYKGYSAFGAGATYRSRDGAWLVNGALSVTGQGDAGVRAQVGYEF